MLNDQPASAEATAQQAPNGLLVLRWKTDVAGFRGLECGERPEPKSELRSTERIHLVHGGRPVTC